jgi:2-keto-4-pentenoate hydratase/2-oxohepta-3-ene-1,7-dioic acid hydratase in catechol pathway
MSRDSTTTAWSLVTYRTGDDPVERVGSLDPEGVVRAAPELCEYRGLMPALEDWPEVAAILERCDHRGEESVGDAKVLAPLRYPRKILCAGAKYWSHLREMGGSLDQGALEDPSFFLLPATSIVGHGGGDPIEIPTDDHANVDWQGELAVVIGRPARNVSAESARAHVAGYTICNDISAREFHRRTSYPAPPFEWDWLRSKGRDTFLPIGPGVTPAWLVNDPHDLRLRLWVNDNLKQDARTSDLILDIWHLVAAASQTVTLEPGDIVTTGTPDGVGAARGEFLRSGDVVTVEIDGLGRLSNPVRTEPRSRVVVEGAIPTSSPTGTI